MNQKWNLTGNIRYGDVRTLCLARNSGSEGNGTGLSVQTCSEGADAQTWDYYF
jgi:hypothetical protein